MRTLLGFKVIILLAIIFFILRIIQFWSLTEFSLPHDAHHYLLLGKNLVEGKGYISRSVWAISLRPEAIPFPDFYRSPGLPFLYFLVFKIGGINFWSAKVLTAFLAAGVLLVTYLLSLVVLKNQTLALLSSFLLFLNPVFYKLSGGFLAELPYTLFSLITLYFLFSSKGKRSLMIGLFWGLAYFCRYQALFFLVVTILFYLILRHGVLKGLKYLLFAICYLLLVVGPWLYRNFKITGDPFYTDLKYHLAAVYQNNFSQYFFGFEHPPEAINVFLSRPFYVAYYFLNSAYQLLIQIPMGLLGNLTIFFLAIFGVVILLKEERILGLTLFLYLLLNYFFFSFSLPETRYLYPLLPIILILATAGINFLWKRLKAKKEDLKTLLVWLYIFIFLGVFYYFDSLLLTGYRLDSKKAILCELLLTFSVWLGFRSRRIFTNISRRSLAFVLILIFATQYIIFLSHSFSYPLHPTALEAYRSARLAKKLIVSQDAVLMTGGMPYYFEYFLNRPVIQFPYYKNKEEFEEIVKKYQVKFFIITKTQKEFYPWLEDRLPANFSAVAQKPDITFYVQK
jgi:4-amino-4-deoxy-L-arabinose transferase-like glycosyltransferase